jgi:Ankyrin repeats (many copies)
MPDSDDNPNDREFVWPGVLDPSLLNDHVVSAAHRLADAAKAGDWTTVFRLLDHADHLVNINQWRPGGKAWFTALHQAAWHGAPTEVAAELIRRGALRSLQDSRGRIAYDIRLERDAVEHGPKDIVAQYEKSFVLREGYLSPPPSPLSPDRIRALDAHLAVVIDGRIRGVLFDGRDPRRVLRYPLVGILHEVPGQQLWFPVPGMYGGFDITLRQGYLDVRSWCRVVGGSGQAHLITHEGAVLVDEGFV